MRDHKNTRRHRQLIFKAKTVHRWYWLPISVFLLGMLSTAMLMWNRSIGERHHFNFDQANILLNIHIEVAAYHLWLEEALAGDETLDIIKVQDGIDHPINLAKGILEGGYSRHGMILEPIKNLNLRKEIEDIKSLLTELKTIALLRLEDPKKAGVGSVLDQRFDAVFEEFLTKSSALETVMERKQVQAHDGWQRLFNLALLVWTSIVLVSIIGLWSRERYRIATQVALQEANEQLELRTEDLRKHKEHLLELVEERTVELTETNRNLLREIDERKAVEEALRATERRLRTLSLQLLLAQETERSRISRELHDELGQALTIIKLRIRFIEKNLEEEQREIREECEELLPYIDQTIEEIRRLSRDLSPTLLEDLGLTAALRWLTTNTAKVNNLQLKVDMGNIDHMFSKETQIVIYRIFQEALTNVVKHARAKALKVTVNHNEGINDIISFSVEDDGRGFDVNQAFMQDRIERGLGLVTMSERVRMLGGELSIDSGHGEGTRIAFHVGCK